jgi:hypothetical protein
MRRFFELSGLYKRKYYQRTGKGGPVLSYLQSHFEGAMLSKEQFRDIGPHKIASGVRSFADLLKKAAKGPVAPLLEPAAAPGGPNVDSFARVFSALRARQFEADIYGVKKQHVDLRATVVDGQGHVLFDSLGRSLGADFSRWRDVRLALEGKYGARTTRDTDDDAASEVMYVSVPVFYQDRIVGAVTVGKPVTSLGQYMQSAQHKTLVAGVTAAVAALVLMMILSLWLVIPSGLVADYLRRVIQAYALAMPVAFVCVMVVRPLVGKLVAATVHL